MEKVINVTYISVWNDGEYEIDSAGKYNTETNKVFDVESVLVDDLDLEILNREYIVFPDGSEKKVVQDGEMDDYKEELQRKEVALLEW